MIFVAAAEPVPLLRPAVAGVMLSLAVYLLLSCLIAGQ
jgi:hypothetical protein